VLFQWADLLKLHNSIKFAITFCRTQLNLTALSNERSLLIHKISNFSLWSFFFEIYPLITWYFRLTIFVWH